MRYLIFLLLVFPAVGWSQNPPPSPAPQTAIRRPPNQESEGTQDQTNTEQQGSEQSPFVIKILPPEQAHNESQANGSKGPSNPTNSWGLSDKIAVIASLVAFLQFIALVLTVGVMVFYGRRQLRAYVLMQATGILEGNMLEPPQPARANKPGIAMLMKNFGQTPAYKVISVAEIKLVLLSEERTALITPQVTEQCPLTLGRDGTFSKALWFDHPLTAEEIKSIEAGILGIYINGRIEYKDIFKKNRFANFRLRYTGKFPPLPGAIFNFSTDGNDAN